MPGSKNNVGAPELRGWTEEQVFAILKNLGHDVNCGACMAVAFTGYSMPGDEHTCFAKRQPSAYHRSARVWFDRAMKLPKVLLELPTPMRMKCWWRDPWCVHPTWRGAVQRGLDKFR